MDEASADLESLLLVEAQGLQPSEQALAWVERRLVAARGLQEASVRRRPLAAFGHVGLARASSLVCAARAFRERRADRCHAAPLSHLRDALALGPFSGRTHGAEARYLAARWVDLGPDEHAEARGILRRASELNRADAELRRLHHEASREASNKTSS